MARVVASRAPVSAPPEARASLCSSDARACFVCDPTRPGRRESIAGQTRAPLASPCPSPRCELEHPVPRLLCKCSQVSEQQVRQAIRRGARSISQIGEACDAGTGCQSCHPSLTALLRETARNVDEAQLGLFSARPKS
ncbi:MAG: (2Fe-2S)-binding protein [Myxococcales bacterium FL481]|nr:MAG: (2Fe-2S)-binding protein [Myxococcales bacterium FL481]